MPSPKVLIIEDDTDLASILSYNIGKAGYEVLAAHDGLEGLRLAQSHSPEVILLDLMLPVMDGFEVCRQLRADPRTAKCFVIMLTAKSGEAEQVAGLALGADDYVTKPFSMNVLLERIKALKRRARETPSDDSIEVQGVRIDRRAHKAWAGEEEMPLTLSEFRLLELFARQPGRVMSRRELVSEVLGDAEMIHERTIDVHIRSLRLKLGEYADRIETVRRAGYRFREG